MITSDQLKIYARNKGDGDRLNKSDRELVSDSDWHLIDTLLQDAVVVNRKLGSEERTGCAIKRIRDNSADAEVIAEIHRLAETLNS